MAVAKVLCVVTKVMLCGSQGAWGCSWDSCYVAARFLGVDTRVVAMVPGVVARVLLCSC